MERWRHCWRNGFAKVLTTEDLLVLKRALEKDDQTLIQEDTVLPPSCVPYLGHPVECACAIAFCGWKRGLSFVGEVVEFFGKTCCEADQLLGRPSSCRYFLNWFDNAPREEVRQKLLEEVILALSGVVAKPTR